MAPEESATKFYSISFLVVSVFLPPQFVVLGSLKLLSSLTPPHFFTNILPFPEDVTKQALLSHQAESLFTEVSPV